jgi:hypothetical protein
VDFNSRSELRDVNELNFARFDAKVEQRFAESDARMDVLFAKYDAKMEKRFAEYDVKIEKRFAAFETRILRWMFTLWTGTTITLAGVVLVALRAR